MSRYKTVRILSEIRRPARIEHLRELVAFVDKCAKTHGIDSERCLKIGLATEEILVNIFDYAYQGGEGDVRVRCGADQRGWFAAEFEDTGIPFDMLASDEPDTTADISERRIGGLGIHLVRKLMDEVAYRRDGDANILTIIIRP